MLCCVPYNEGIQVLEQSSIYFVVDGNQSSASCAGCLMPPPPNSHQYPLHTNKQKENFTIAENLTVDNDNIGSQFTKLSQLVRLTGGLSWFCNKHRIIVTNNKITYLSGGTGEFGGSFCATSFKRTRQVSLASL